MSLYKRKDSDVWWADISHPHLPRIRRSTGQTDRVAAQRVHDEFKAELWSRPVITGHAWSEAVMLWVGDKERSTSELLSLKKFGKRFKDRALSEVTRESVHNALSFAKTPGTYNRYRGMINAILNRAKEEGWLTKLPDLAVKPSGKAKPRTWLTPAQWERLYAELPAHMKPMAQFAIETGLRQANVLQLRWAQVDLGRRLVWIEGEDTKAGKAIPIPLSSGAVHVLESQQGRHPEFVFTYRERPIKEIKTAFISACVRADVGAYVDGRYRGFTWHGFRHTWATWHVQNGTPLNVLQNLGGWSDLRMVMNYAHHTAGYLASFADNARSSKAP